MLTVTAERLVAELDNLKGMCMEQILCQNLDNFDEKTIKAMQSTLKVISLSNQMMIEQAEMLDNINKKMDKLLEKTK